MHFQFDLGTLSHRGKRIPLCSGRAARPWPAIWLAIWLLGAFAPTARAVPLAGPEAAPHAARQDALVQSGEPGKRVRVGADALAVLYPDIGEPYRKVFTEIIEGIEDQSRLRVRAYPVGANNDPAELQAALKSNGSRVVIALGRQGLKAASGLDLSLALVVGGVSSVPEPEKLHGITLTPDPALLFLQLRNLLPGIRRVLVVYNPVHSEALIKLAREAARAQGLELVGLEAADLAGAARRYEAAFAGADGRRDALWLAPDPTTVDEGTILPIVLRESWNRNVPIFSSSILHVKKGALFALYPNNFELGRELAGLAMAALNGETQKHGVTPLRAVRTALNSRTASHIGLTIGPGQQRAFDAVFPEP